MKKTKLLTSLAALALVLGLGACEANVGVDVGGVDVGGVDVDVDVDTDKTSEPDEGDGDDGDGNTGDTGEGGDTGTGSGGGEGGDTIISEDVEDALALLGQYGADTSSWSGVNYSWKLDESETLYGSDYYGEAYDDTILATETDGVVKGLYEETESMSMFGYTLYEDFYGEFYDGTTLFALDDGELSSEEESIPLTYFTSYPYYYAEYDIEYFAQFAGYTSIYKLLYGYDFEGSVTQLKDGNLVVYVAISSEYDYYDEDYGTIVGSFILSLEVVYDADGGLVSVDYEAYEDDSYTDMNMGLLYIESETCSDFVGDIAAPEWAVEEE